MGSDGNQPRQTASEEDPKNTAENGSVLREIGGAKIEQHAIQPERHTVEPILAVERRIGEHLGRQLSSEQDVSTATEREVKRADDQDDRRQGF